ncbi:aldehyde dehydrogenase family protein [Cyclobacterium qasimii]|uniref:Aldehyde dehydrogenase n=2 Tax=Cyclobacterium qasimii TaxID=1350429 RepID=S7VQM7_9BACT|nr:aldehyde dehydrogenase family protein [Cyclobacterium qasimii]EPR71647.1 Aldehyde dehydrogenase [Cyclobacterium qasimii M12-11B]GEO22438.1 aldehyde dehydrogenase [Cyclobacterium qasimii]
MDIINPATGSTIEKLTEDTAVEVSNKIAALKEGQKKWVAVPLEERIAIVKKYGDLVMANLDELAKILTSETGKPIQQAKNEIKGAQNRIDHIQKDALKWLQKEIITEEGGTREEIVFEPLGVIANISAWNFPYNVGYNVFLYALLAGNAVAYKPSEFASLTGLKFRELLLEAGIPKDAFECFIGGAEVGELLLEADLDGYFFTGSYKTGKYIAQKVASKLVPVQLELGGKDPLYVMEDVADVKQAAINAAEGAFYNNGQSCCAVERVYVHEKIYDEFVAAFVDEVSTYKIGDPNEEGTFIGPLTRADQMNVILSQITDAKNKGAEVLYGGEKWGDKGYYLIPAVLTNVDHSMDLMMEESFGPIIGIQKVKNDEEAFELMNDTSYGLTAAVFSGDELRAKQLVEKLPTGTVYVNCCDRVSPNLPWTGRKNSGMGVTLSYMGIRAFTQPKAYHIRG